MTDSANPRSPESGEMSEPVRQLRAAISRTITLVSNLHPRLATRHATELRESWDRAYAAIGEVESELSTARERADRAEQAVKRAVEIADDHCARGKEVMHYTASEPIGARGGCIITKVGDLVDVRDDLERHVRATVDPDWHFNVTRYRDRATSDA